jgi:hypothetical protein
MVGNVMIVFPCVCAGMGRLTLVLTLLCLGVAAVYALAGEYARPPSRSSGPLGAHVVSVSHCSSSNQALQPMHEAVEYVLPSRLFLVSCVAES